MGRGRLLPSPSPSMVRTVVAALLVAVAGPASAKHIPPPTEHPRLYLLSGPIDGPVLLPNWEGLLTADRDDLRGSEDVIESTGILAVPTGSHQLVFRQADRYFELVPGGTFRLRIDTNDPDPSVRLIVVAGTQLVGEFPAQQTSPGVFTGAVDRDVISNGADELRIGVRVSARYGERVRLHVDGGSWFQPREPVAARTLAEVQALAPPAPQPGAFETAWRSFRFNDAAWRVLRFEGALTPDAPQATHPFDVAGARILYAWVELDTDAFVRDLARGSVRTEDLSEMMLLSLLHEGGVMATGSNNGAQTTTGSPVDAAAIEHPPPGGYALDVRLKDGSRGMPYEAYALVIDGERTLASATARFLPRAGGATIAAYGSGLHGGSVEPFPFLEPAAMMHVRLDHDGPLADHQEFDLRLTDPWSGFARFLDDQAWVTHPAPLGMWTAEQGPSGDAVSVSWHDVVFSVTADYLYDPIPHPEEEEDA